MPSPTEFDTWIEAPSKMLRRCERLAPGVLLVDGDRIDFSSARMMLLDDEFAVRVIEGSALSTRQAAQSAIVSALSLPISAATNLDALVDALRDLDLWYPRTRRIALVWKDASVLRDADPDGFGELVDILTIAHDELWSAAKEDGAEGAEHDRAFLAVLLPADTTASPIDPTAPEIQ